VSNQLRIEDILELQDFARKYLAEISMPLSGMTRNFTEGERIGMAYFQAALVMLNKLTGSRISDQVIVKFEDLDVEPIIT